VRVAFASTMVTLVSVSLPVFVAAIVKGTMAPTVEKVVALDDLASAKAAVGATTGLTSMLADA
jgi:hypothetical protein